MGVVCSGESSATPKEGASLVFSAWGKILLRLLSVSSGSAVSTASVSVFNAIMEAVAGPQHSVTDDRPFRNVQIRASA